MHGYERFMHGCQRFYFLCGLHRDRRHYLFFSVSAKHILQDLNQIQDNADRVTGETNPAGPAGPEEDCIRQGLQGF